MTLPRRKRPSRSSWPETAEHKGSSFEGEFFRVRPWKQGIVKGFVIESHQEGQWFVFGMVYNTEAEARRKMESL